jgi:hypothetical protein
LCLLCAQTRLRGRPDTCGSSIWILHERAYANGYAFSANKVHVYTWYIDSTTHNSVYANNYAYLTITY